MTRLSFCDTLDIYASIADMTFSVAWNGVRPSLVPVDTNDIHCSQDRPVPELVAATGSGPMGGFTLFQVHACACFHSARPT